MESCTLSDAINKLNLTDHIFFMEWVELPKLVKGGFIFNRLSCATLKKSVIEMLHFLFVELMSISCSKTSGHVKLAAHCGY